MGRNRCSTGCRNAGTDAMHHACCLACRWKRVAALATRLQLGTRCSTVCRTGAMDALLPSLPGCTMARDPELVVGLLGGTLCMTFSRTASGDATHHFLPNCMEGRHAPLSGGHRWGRDAALLGSLQLRTRRSTACRAGGRDAMQN